MPTIGIRVPFYLKDKIQEAAKASNKDMSEFLRDLIEDNLQPGQTDDWELAAWTLFKMSPEQISYALSHSRSPEEFFASISHKAPNLEIKVARTSDTLTISFTYGGAYMAVSCSRLLHKIEAISQIVLSMDSQIQAKQLEATNVENIFECEDRNESEGKTGEDLGNPRS